MVKIKILLTLFIVSFILGCSTKSKVNIGKDENLNLNIKESVKIKVEDPITSYIRFKKLNDIKENSNSDKYIEEIFSRALATKNWKQFWIEYKRLIEKNRKKWEENKIKSEIIKELIGTDEVKKQ